LKRLTGVIFDMDGVIVDSEPIHYLCDTKTLEDYGVAVDFDEMQRYIGVGNEAMWSDLIKRHQIKATVEELTKRQDDYKKELFGKDNIVAVKGIESLIKKLHKKDIKIALASSSPKYFIESILKSLDLLNYFGALVSGDEVTRSKPEPDIYLKAAELIGISPMECMAIEDAAAGVIAAKAAGMYTIGYKNPNSGNQDLSPADLIVESIWEVENRLKAILID
jgi:beta-phosphoglucomutase family hydrolase